MTSSSSRGNALLFVLIGIALFAALMFVMSRGTRYNTGAVENAAILAQQITSYADKVNSAVQNLTLQNGCLDTQISFENPIVAGYTNGAISKCKVFDPAGGGLSFQHPPAAAFDSAAATTAGNFTTGDYYIHGNTCVYNAGTGPTDNLIGPTCSTTSVDLVFLLPYVTQAVCAQIDQITMNTTTIPTDTGAQFGTTKFIGTYGTGSKNIVTGSKTYSTGCYYSTNVGSPGIGYIFYSVLLAR